MALAVERRRGRSGGSQAETALWAERAGLSRGERARGDHDTYLTRKAGSRNECWEADHTELAIRAQPPGGSLVRPWLTLFVGLSTRAIPGWAVQAPAGGLGPRTVTETREQTRPLGLVWSWAPHQRPHLVDLAGVLARAEVSEL